MTKLPQRSRRPTNTADVVSTASPDELAAAQAALATSEARLELATSAGDIGIWDWDVRTNEMVYSERAKALFGFPAHAPVTFEQVRDATHPDDLPTTSAMARRALDPERREREPYEYRIVRPDGSIRWVLANGQAIFTDIGGKATAIRYIGTVQDITARKDQEEALRASESRLRLAIDAGRMAVWEFDPATDKVVGSPELNRILGFPPDTSPSIAEMRTRYAPGEQERLARVAQEAIQRGDHHFEIEYRTIIPEDSTRWLLLRAEMRVTPDGRPERIIGVLLDITEEKRAAERQERLTHELNHRVKNNLATVQALITQTLRGARGIGEARTSIESRLLSLSRAHDLLTDGLWEAADLRALVEQTLSAFDAFRDRMRYEGPNARLAPRAAVNLALALHELLTNALKYGALSNDAGRIDLGWTIDGDSAARRIRMTWEESGGPPVSAPAAPGLGTRIVRELAAEFGGTAEFDFRPTGLTCVIDLPLPTPAGAAPGHRS